MVQCDNTRKQESNMESLVTPEWLAGEMGASDLRIVDATKFLPDAGRNALAEYEAGHSNGEVRAG